MKDEEERVYPISIANMIDNAISKGLRFLKGTRCKDSLWRDFDTLAGKSSDWVSAFVSYSVSDSLASERMTLSTRRILMHRQRPNGGWSYNRYVPTDCDSTAWALLALSQNKRYNESVIKRGIHYIQQHQDRTQGGFSTYNADDQIDTFIQLHNKHLDGWYSLHVDVTSIVIQCLMSYDFSLDSEIIRKAALYVNRERYDNCYWKSYWWKGYSYSTYNALKALLICKSIGLEHLKKILLFLSSSQKQDGGWNDSCGDESEVFATAFVILTLLLYPMDITISHLKKGIYWLLCVQNADGSWPVRPILKIPPPLISNPDTIKKWRNNEIGTGVMIEDKKRIFTSSSVLRALITFRSIVLNT
jgi:squalene cyclase